LNNKNKYKKCACGKEIRVSSRMCRSCSVNARKSKFKGSLKESTIKICNNFIVDLKNFEVYDFKTKVKFSRKYKFLMVCLSCNNNFSTYMGKEKKKKNKFYCQSCAISNEWKSSEYKEKHVSAIIKTKSTKASKKKHSEAQIKKWKNPVTRKKMLDSHRLLQQTPEWRAKVSMGLKKRWKENPPKCISRKYIIKSNKGNIVLRSSYEREFVRYLDENKINWEYEPKSFILKTYSNRVLIPDFYLKEYDLWVEIKGYFWHDAKEKWNAFCDEYSNLKKIILFKKDLNNLINKEKTIEDYI
jgi:hypothetical protein